MGLSPRMGFQQGDHACMLYLTPEEQLVAASEYVRGGLERGERCVYVCCEHTPAELRVALRTAGVDAQAEEQRGALILLTKEHSHLEGGSFEPDRMMAMLEQALHDALAAGFKGLRAGGDMVWLLDEAPGCERIAEYEARLNRFYESTQSLGLCLYNLKTMPPALIDHCLATHKYIRIEGPILLTNPFYELPEEAYARVAQADTVHEKLHRLGSMA
jgi:hypothetical protein